MAINRNDWINEVKQDAYGATGNPAQLSTASGSAPSYSARAWVNFAGSTGVIRASGNVSSVTDNGVGDFTINFTTPLADTNYSFIGASSANAGDTTPFHPTVSNTYGLNTTNLRINCRGQDRVTLADVVQAMIVIFR